MKNCKICKELIIRENKAKIKLLRNLVHDISTQFLDVSIDEKLVVKRVLDIIEKYYYK